LLGLLVAAGYGSADFLGGLATRRIPVWLSLFGAQLAGLALALALGFGAGGSLSATDAWWSVAAGAATVVGLGFLFHGLATGAASVVAPATAVGATVIQVVAGLLRGERPGALALVGVGVALVAVALVATAPGEAGGVRLHDVAVAAGAAAGLGLSLVFFTETSHDAGLWPVVVARAVGLPLALLAVLIRRVGIGGTFRRPHGPAVAASGALDATANALLLIAVRRELLTLVAPIASLAPAMTVFLARVVHKERLGRTRLVGVALALVGLALIAVRA
jgi:drug/metabolite transporter (DMT)-like permease